MARLFNYGRPRATAERLIGRFGVAAELRQDGVDYPVHAVLVDYRANQIDGTLIMRGDFTAILPSSEIGVVPRPGAVLFWEGRERTIVNVATVKPGPERVVYTLQLRGPR